MNASSLTPLSTLLIERTGYFFPHRLPRNYRAPPPLPRPARLPTRAGGFNAHRPRRLTALLHLYHGALPPLPSTPTSAAAARYPLPAPPRAARAARGKPRRLFARGFLPRTHTFPFDDARRRRIGFSPPHYLPIQPLLSKHACACALQAGRHVPACLI